MDREAQTGDYKMRAGPPPKRSRIKDPQELARFYLEKHKNNVVEATNDMTATVMADMDLYRIIMDPLVRMACYNYITGACRRNRKKIWDMPQPSPKSESDKVLHRARATASAYMMFMLPGGVMLKDATGKEVGEAVVFYLNQGRDMVIKGRWLRMIEQRVPPDKKVPTVLKEEDLAKLKIQAENDI